MLNVNNTYTDYSVKETLILGKEVKVYESLDSTNNKIKELADMGAIEGTTVVALEQTSGRGRNKKVWESKKGDGLYFSLLLRPNLEIINPSVLTLVAGLGICRALIKMGIACKIKWPNDILVNGLKICGILSEMVLGEKNKNYVVLGIGINTNKNDFEDNLKNIGTSIGLIKGSYIDWKEVLSIALRELEEIYFRFIENGFSDFIEEYNRYSCILGKNVKIISTNQLECVAEEIMEDGALKVKTLEGKYKVIYSGEVSLRL